MAEKVVVIGGSGFLGSHVADTLSDAGYAVDILDVTPSPWLRPDQNMVVGDIMDREVLDRTLAGARYVYHMAGIADIVEASDRPRETLSTNIMGSVEVVETCVRHKVEKLLYASTLYVYSDKGSFYRVSKQAVELILEGYHERFGLPYTILRYGSLYGPRAQDWNGLMRFVVQAVNEGRIVYPGTGLERREYIHVADAAKLSVRAIDKAYDNQCLTVTGTQVMTTKQMLETIREIYGEGIELIFTTREHGYNLFRYDTTPYRYTPKLGMKVVPNEFIDLGQGILELIGEVCSRREPPKD